MNVTITFYKSDNVGQLRWGYGKVMFLVVVTKVNVIKKDHNCMLQDDEADDDVDNDNEEEGDTDQLDSDEEQEETAQRFGGFTTKAKKGYGKLYFYP